MRRMNGGGIRPLFSAAAAVAVLILPLSACGAAEPETNISEADNDGQDKPNSQGATPTPEDRPAPDMPALPEEAKEKSDDGAAAFGDYYIKLWRWSEQNDDFDTIGNYLATECDSCDPMRGPAAGHFTSGGETKILNSRGGEQFEKNRWNASVTFTIKAGTWVANTPDAEPEQQELQDVSSRIELIYKEGNWKVVDITFDA